MEERGRLQDLLRQVVQNYFRDFLRSMEEDYQDFRHVIKQISILDCLCSLATVSANNSYCKPDLVDYPVVDVKKARHPIVEQIMDDPFIDNDVCLSEKAGSTMILTGNNMGGKSITSKMIACIVIMSQVRIRFTLIHSSLIPSTSIQTSHCCSIPDWMLRACRTRYNRHF